MTNRGQRPAIQIISAPSILGLKPTGVDELPASLLSKGLPEKLRCLTQVIQVPSLNEKYNFNRDGETGCLNAGIIKEFSIGLGIELSAMIDQEYFPLVLGGDCSILIGIFSALKAMGSYGLLYCDAHADFYQPEKSPTGELADMDLAVITGRGPDKLTNINGLKPYVHDEHVIHIGQRDWEETQKYGSQDIRETTILCLDYQKIETDGIASTTQKIVQAMNSMNIKGSWIHFDTDVLSDEENPAVDYRLPGGLSSKQCGELLKGLIATNKIIGMSVTIFNPRLDDKKGSIAKMLTDLISRSLAFLCVPLCLTSVFLCG